MRHQMNPAAQARCLDCAQNHLPNTLLARSWPGPHEAPLDPVASRISESGLGQGWRSLPSSPSRHAAQAFTHRRASLIGTMSYSSLNSSLLVRSCSCRVGFFGILFLQRSLFYPTKRLRGSGKPRSAANVPLKTGRCASASQKKVPLKTITNSTSPHSPGATAGE